MNEKLKCRQVKFKDGRKIVVCIHEDYPDTVMIEFNKLIPIDQEPLPGSEIIKVYKKRKLQRMRISLSPEALYAITQMFFEITENVEIPKDYILAFMKT